MSTKQSNFEGKFFVLRESSLFDFPLVKKIVFINDNIQLINAMNEKYGEKIVQINFTGEINKSLEIKNVDKQLVKIFPQNKKAIIKISKSLKEKKFLIYPDYPISKLEDISMISSMGLTVDLIPIIETIDFDTSLEILDYYLHNRNLKVPIEPFHSILISKLLKKTKTIWNMNLTNPDLFYYSDGEGLSEDTKNLKNRIYLYLVQHRPKAFLKQGNRSSLESFFKSLPETHPKCLACPHFHMCIAWALYQKDTCAKWKKILSILQEASREIQVLEKFEKDHAIVQSGHKVK